MRPLFRSKTMQYSPQSVFPFLGRGGEVEAIAQCDGGVSSIGWRPKRKLKGCFTFVARASIGEIVELATEGAVSTTEGEIELGFGVGRVPPLPEQLLRNFVRTSVAGQSFYQFIKGKEVEDALVGHENRLALIE